jgi:hypothetical protein
MILTEYRAGSREPPDCTRPLLIGVLFEFPSMMLLTRRAALLLALLSLLAACGGGAKLDDRVLQLALTYTAEGPVEARMIGERGAATADTMVECRLTTGDKPLVGQATANEIGAFDMELDHAEFPERIPSTAEFTTFNETIECRPEGGAWVNPLRQPLLRVD